MTGLPQGWALAPINTFARSRSGNSKLIKGQQAQEPAAGLFPAFSASGQDVWVAVPEHEGNAIIISAVGARCGKTFRATGQWSAVANTHIVWPEEVAVDTDWLQLLLNDENFWEKGGSAQPFVKVNATFEREIPLPPLPEQRRIVRRLETLSARSTTARTHLTAIEKLVERYKLAVLSGSLFRNGTPVKRLGEVLTDIRYGTAAKCSYDPSGTPVLRIPNIQSGRIDRTDLKSAHFAKKEIEQLALKAGDILVIRSNGSPDLVGRVALVTDGETDCLFAGYLIRLRLSATEALPEYVRLCFESDEVRAIIEAASKSTSGVNNVNSTQLKEIALPMPTVDEQREIVRRIETAFGKIDRLATEAAKALKLLGHLDQRILAKAFSGDLVPQDPTDEPAESLLNRIRDARATAPKARRGRK